MIARIPSAGRRRRTPLTRAPRRRSTAQPQPLSPDEIREALRIAAALIFPTPRAGGRRVLILHERD